MKFGIERASSYFPCDEAVEHKYINIDDKEDFFYTIEINTLEELMKLYKKYGKLIIREVYDFEPEYINAGCEQKIVIYDDYVE